MGPTWSFSAWKKFPVEQYSRDAWTHGKYSIEYSTEPTEYSTEPKAHSTAHIASILQSIAHPEVLVTEVIPHAVLGVLKFPLARSYRD